MRTDFGLVIGPKVRKRIIDTPKILHFPSVPCGLDPSSLVLKARKRWKSQKRKKKGQTNRSFSYLHPPHTLDQILVLKLHWWLWTDGVKHWPYDGIVVLACTEMRNMLIVQQYHTSHMEHNPLKAIAFTAPQYRLLVFMVPPYLEPVLWKAIASLLMARGEATLHRLFALWRGDLQKATPWQQWRQKQERHRLLCFIFKKATNLGF